MADKDQPDATTAKEPPAIPPQGQRQHHATWARDKKRPGKYLIRVAGPHAGVFAGRQVPVTRMDRSESVETLTVAVWAGIDEETGENVALYQVEERPRDDAADALPF